MKITVVYFSSTGNTDHAVRLLSERLSREGHRVTLQNVDRKSFTLPDTDFDILVAAFPVLAFTAPHHFLYAMKKLPKAQKGQRAAVLAVDGDGGLNAAQSVKTILKSRSYDVFLTARAGYCENWKQVNATPPLEAREKHTMEGDKQTERFATDLLAGKREFYLTSVPVRLLCRLTAFLFLLVGRKFFGKFHVADKDCNLCGLCARTCPVSSITMDANKRHKPMWDFNCESCNRCLNICPKNAVNVSVARILLLVTAATGFCILLVMLWLENLAPLVSAFFPLTLPVQIIAITILIILGHWLTAIPFDILVLRPLSRIKIFERFFSLSYTKNSLQYWMKGFKP